MCFQAKAVIGVLSKNCLWMRTLGSTPINERENRERYLELVPEQVQVKLKLGQVVMCKVVALPSQPRLERSRRTTLA